MKKLLIVSLCMIGILVLAGTAFATIEEDEYCQVYRSTVVSDDPIMLGSWDDCIEVCIYPDGFAEAWTYCNYSDYLILSVEGLGWDFKNLVGYSFYYPKACHASIGKRGNNLEADCVLDMNGGIKIHARGVPDNNCQCMKED